MKTTVTTHRYNRETCERLNLIAKGVGVVRKIKNGIYEHYRRVEFNGHTWEVSYTNRHRVEQWSPQCMVPCLALGCEMIDWTINSELTARI